MVAPALLWFELASICLRKIKAHPKQKEELLQALDLAGRLPIQPIEVDQPEVVQRIKKKMGSKAGGKWGSSGGKGGLKAWILPVAGEKGKA